MTYWQFCSLYRFIWGFLAWKNIWPQLNLNDDSSCRLYQTRCVWVFLSVVSWHPTKLGIVSLSILSGLTFFGSDPYVLVWWRHHSRSEPCSNLLLMCPQIYSHRNYTQRCCEDACVHIPEHEWTQSVLRTPKGSASTQLTSSDLLWPTLLRAHVLICSEPPA